MNVSNNFSESLMTILRITFDINLSTVWLVYSFYIIHVQGLYQYHIRLMLSEADLHCVINKN